MSKPRRQQVARRGPPTSSEGLARERIIALDKLLKDDAIGGRLDHDPDFRDRILAHGFNALHELVVMAHDPQYPPSVRALAMFKAGDHTLQPLKPIDSAGEIGPASIVIQVANWASAKPSVPVLPEPETVIIDADAVRTNGSPPTPTLSDRERLRAQVLAQRETVLVEAPVSPSEPARVIGRVSPGRPYELSETEKLRIMETLKNGPPNEENHQMLFPELQRERQG